MRHNNKLPEKHILAGVLFSFGAPGIEMRSPWSSAKAFQKDSDFVNGETLRFFLRVGPVTESVGGWSRLWMKQTLLQYLWIVHRLANVLR